MKTYERYRIRFAGFAEACESMTKAEYEKEIESIADWARCLIEDWQKNPNGRQYEEIISISVHPIRRKPQAGDIHRAIRRLG